MFGMSRIRHCTLWLVMLEKNDSIAIIQYIQKRWRPCRFCDVDNLFKTNSTFQRAWHATTWLTQITKNDEVNYSIQS